MKKLSSKLQNWFAGFVSVVSLLVVSNVSMAVLPAAATTAFADLTTDGLALVDLAWTAVVPITIAFIILRMFRRAAASV